MPGAINRKELKLGYAIEFNVCYFFSLFSDDDEYYDRSKKKANVPKTGQSQAIETADSLLDKRDAIRKQMEEKKELLLNEKKKLESDSAAETDAGDALDAYMSGLSSQLSK